MSSAAPKSDSHAASPGSPRDREAVVLRGDRDPAGAQVLDRVVGAAVAERELERLQADRAAEQLVAEADAEHRLAPTSVADRCRRCSRARPGRRGRGRGRTPSGSRASSSSARRRARVAARASRRASVKLRTIERLMPVSSATIRGPSPSPSKIARLGDRHLAGEVAADHARLGVDPLARLAPRGIVAGEDPAAHRARVADVADERARVDAGDARDAVVAQPVEPALLGAGRVVVVDRRAHDRRRARGCGRTPSPPRTTP